MNNSLNSFIIKIKNGLEKKHKTINLHYSFLFENVLNVLEFEGFIAGFKIIGQAKTKRILVFLKFHQNKSVINSIRRISKTNRRVYIQSIHLVFANISNSLYVISTPRGVLSHTEALKFKIGGEVLLKVC